MPEGVSRRQDRIPYANENARHGGPCRAFWHRCFSLHIVRLGQRASSNHAVLRSGIPRLTPGACPETEAYPGFTLCFWDIEGCAFRAILGTIHHLIPAPSNRKGY